MSFAEIGPYQFVIRIPNYDTDNPSGAIHWAELAKASGAIASIVDFVFADDRDMLGGTPVLIAADRGSLELLLEIVPRLTKGAVEFFAGQYATGLANIFGIGGGAAGLFSLLKLDKEMSVSPEEAKERRWDDPRIRAALRTLVFSIRQLDRIEIRTSLGSAQISAHDLFEIIHLIEAAPILPRHSNYNLVLDIFSLASDGSGGTFCFLQDTFFADIADQYFMIFIDRYGSRRFNGGAIQCAVTASLGRIDVVTRVDAIARFGETVFTPIRLYGDDTDTVKVRA